MQFTQEQKIEQAINRMHHIRCQYELLANEEKSPMNAKSYRDTANDFDTALSALRAQQERDNPQPLAVEELKQMDGQPVWWWNKSHAPVCTLCVKNKADTYNPFFVCYDDPFADDDCTGLVKYQKLIKWGWRPYQYPPKEANDGKQ